MRKVASFKEMFCVVFNLPADYIYTAEAIVDNNKCMENIKKRNVDLLVLKNSENDDYNLKIQKMS